MHSEIRLALGNVSQYAGPDDLAAAAVSVQTDLAELDTTKKKSSVQNSKDVERKNTNYSQEKRSDENRQENIRQNPPRSYEQNTKFQTSVVRRNSSPRRQLTTGNQADQNKNENLNANKRGSWSSCRFC